MEPGKKPRPGTERTEGGYNNTQRDSRRKRKRLPAYWPSLTWPPGHHSQGSTPKGRARWRRAFLNHWEVNLKVGTTTPKAPQVVAPSISFCIGGECTELRRRLMHNCAATGQTRA